MFSTLEVILTTSTSRCRINLIRVDCVLPFVRISLKVSANLCCWSFIWLGTFATKSKYTFVTKTNVIKRKLAVSRNLMHEYLSELRDIFHQQYPQPSVSKLKIMTNVLLITSSYRCVKLYETSEIILSRMCAHHTKLMLIIATHASAICYWNVISMSIKPFDCQW